MSQCTEKWSVMWILVGLKFKMADCTSVPHPIEQESLPIRLDWTYTVRLLLLLMLLLVDLKSKLLFYNKILLERNWELVIENTLLKSIRLKMKKIEIKTTCIIIFFNPRQTGTSALFCNHKVKNTMCNNNNIGKSLTHWLFIQVHPMSTHLATFEQWLARNFLSFVQLVAIRLTKSLGPKVRNDFPLHWLDEKLCFTQRAKKS